MHGEDKREVPWPPVPDGYHRVCASYYTDENTGRGGPCHFFSFR